MSTLGSGYTVGDVLSASNANLGAIVGSGFSTPVLTVANTATITVSSLSICPRILGMPLSLALHLRVTTARLQTCRL